MNTHILKLWVKRLRSGKYSQARGELRKDKKGGGSSYCCLGLLCNIHQRMTGKGHWERRPNGSWYYVVGQNDASNGVLPRGVAQWAGIKNHNVEVDNGQWASQLNDGDGVEGKEPIRPKSFKHIANRLIEADKLGIRM